VRGHGSVNSLRQGFCEWLSRRRSLHPGRIARLLCDLLGHTAVLISIHLASLLLDRNAAEGLTKELIGLIGPAGSGAIRQMLDAPVRHGRTAGQASSAYICRHNIVGERLERIKSEMIAFSGHAVPISLLAFQWGFSDLSTFNRAFKNRFGCTPRSWALRAVSILRA
jgi:AraC-like DNA-binding protein